MIKINISFIFIGCIFLLILFVSTEKDSNKELKKEDNEKQRTVGFLKISKKEFDKSTSFKEHTDSNSFTNSFIPEIKKINKEEIPVVSDNENGENITFKNADEILEHLFPNLEQEWGLEVKNFLKYKFPIEYIPRLLDPEQKKKYKELELERFSALDSLISEPEGPPTKEYKEAFNAIKEHYLPKMINLLSKEQLEKLVERIDQKIFEKFRTRKREGKPLINPSSEEVMKNMSPQEIERLLNIVKQTKEEEEAALRRK